MKRQDDGTLYERWLEGRDADAFAELARRHTPVVYDLAVRASGDRVLAEDLVQEALLDLAQAGTRKPIDVGIVAWLARFAICRARNARSSERSRKRRQNIVGKRRREVDMPDEQLATNDELAHALSCAEPEERTLLAMRYLHGWEYREIAASLSLSQGAARVRVHRALAAVRSRLGVSVGAATPAALAAVPLHVMSDGFLTRAVTLAVQSVPAPAPAASSPAPAPRAGGWRIPALSLGLVSALSAVTLVAADPGATAHLADGGMTDVAQALLVGTANRTPAALGGSVSARRPHAVPRPPEWDDGALVRLGRERGPARTGTADEESGSVTTDPAQQDETRAVPRGDEPLPDEVLRPMSRDTRAATRGLVSSEDERAGNSAGRGKASRPVVEDEMVEADESTDVDEVVLVVADDTEPSDAPEDVVEPEARETRRKARVERKPIEELDVEQQEAIGAAADLVLGLVATADADLTSLTDDRRARRREARRLKEQFRDWRRELRTLDTGAETDPGVRTTRAQRSLSIRVLELLMQVALADGSTAGELVWPDGADWTVALEEVVRILETAQDAGLALPDGAMDGVSDPDDGGPPDASDGVRLDVDPAAGDLPDGSVPDGAMGLPEGAQE